MPSLRKKAKAAVPSFSAADLANITKNNPYIQRLIDDSDLRDNVRTAIDSAKSAYDRLAGHKAPHKALIEDKKLQSDLRRVAESVRQATVALSDAPKRSTPKKGGLRLGRRLLVLAVAGAAALGVSENLRSKVLDTLFGAEEEFQYTPPAGAPATPPASPVTAA